MKIQDKKGYGWNFEKLNENKTKDEQFLLQFEEENVQYRQKSAVRWDLKF